MPWWHPLVRVGWFLVHPEKVSKHVKTCHVFVHVSCKKRRDAHCQHWIACFLCKGGILWMWFSLHAKGLHSGTLGKPSFQTRSGTLWKFLVKCIAVYHNIDSNVHFIWFRLIYVYIYIDWLSIIQYLIAYINLGLGSRARSCFQSHAGWKVARPGRLGPHTWEAQIIRSVGKPGTRDAGLSGWSWWTMVRPPEELPENMGYTFI